MAANILLPLLILGLIVLVSRKKKPDLLKKELAAQYKEIKKLTKHRKT